jgi:hypothetical protein
MVWTARGLRSLRLAGERTRLARATRSFTSSGKDDAFRCRVLCVRGHCVSPPWPPGMPGSQPARRRAPRLALATAIGVAAAALASVSETRMDGATRSTRHRSMPLCRWSRVPSWWCRVIQWHMAIRWLHTGPTAGPMDLVRATGQDPHGAPALGEAARDHKRNSLSGTESREDHGRDS